MPIPKVSINDWIISGEKTQLKLGSFHKQQQLIKRREQFKEEQRDMCKGFERKVMVKRCDQIIISKGKLKKTKIKMFWQKLEKKQSRSFQIKGPTLNLVDPTSKTAAGKEVFCFLPPLLHSPWKIHLFCC